MTKAILSKKQRLEMAIKLMPRSKSVYYDLFCDHGLLGLELQNLMPECTVLWNDSNEGIITSFLEKNPGTKEKLLLCKAQDIVLKNDSGVFLLGVGGHLMVDCLKSWSLQNCLNGRTFVLAPTYYQLDLRWCLAELNAHLEQRSFVWERGVGHELFCVTFPGTTLSKEHERAWYSFESRFWHKQIEINPGAILYLRKRNQSLQKNRHLQGERKNYATELCRFMSGLNED